MPRIALHSLRANPEHHEAPDSVGMKAELRRLVAELQLSQARFKILAEGIPHLVWSSCDQGRWTWASPQWLDHTGQTQEQSHGLGWLDAIHPDDRKATMEAWSDARAHGMLDVEHRIKRVGDSTWRWHHTRSLPIRGTPKSGEKEGPILEWVGTGTDIHDRKTVEIRFS